MSEITLTINGKEVKAQQGDTVLEAAQKADIRIPTLCAHPALEPYGACRLCLVNVEGMRGNPPSCTTPAADGMVVLTDTDEIVETRREILKLMLSEHTSPCLVCYHRELCEKYRPQPFKTGRATRCTFCSNRDSCELRDLAAEHNITEFDLPIIYKNIEIERDDPFMDRDYSLCVLCGRCARICKKIHGSGAIDFVNRGSQARIGTAFGHGHTESDCKFCGACIDICPTGSLTDRFAKWHGAPDTAVETTCVLCPIGCRLNLKLKEGKVIATSMVEPTSDAAICAVGRFGLAQILDNPDRLTTYRVRVEDGLIRTSGEDAIQRAAKKLKGFSGADFGMIAHSEATREEIYVLEKFTSKVMKSDNFAVATQSGDALELLPAPVGKKITEGGVKAVYETGDFIPAAAAEKIDALIVADAFPSDAQEVAEVIIPAAALAETDGSFTCADGETRTLTAAATPPEHVLPDWKIICEIAREMGAEGFAFESTDDIAAEMSEKKIDARTPSAPEPSPIEDVAYVTKYYRGHALSDIVVGLKSMTPGGECIEAETASAPEAAPDDTKPFRIVEKVEVVPNTFVTTILAPSVAKNCKPGQFVIGMANEESERIPYTISDFDADAGTVTLVTLEMGRSSRELARLRTGDHFAHFAGPLGTPVEVKNYGTVVCAGGCFGVGAILPIARAMKEAGNRVICIEEASSHYLLHWRERLSENCDELVIVTKDGSAGMKGGIQEVISMLVGRGEKIDQAYVIGCTFMMMLVSNLTKELEIPTQTAMNPIMLDGTGMCGACRVSLGDDTKFACVDGPFLDGHGINWPELIRRQSAFKSEEVDALPQKVGSGHTCRCEGH